MTEQLDPKPGDWVLIRAQVVDGPTLPECAQVELFSKTDQYQVPVRRDLVVDVVAAPIPDEPHEMAVVLVDGLAYQRLSSPDGWYVAGQSEPLAWADLCRKGKPEVVVLP